MNALGYEHFVRRAFSIALDKDIERSEDPAALANADIFNMSDCHHQVIIGTAYAMEIFSNIIKADSITNEQSALLETIIKNVLNSSTNDEIYSNIELFKDSFKEYIFVQQ